MEEFTKGTWFLNSKLEITDIEDNDICAVQGCFNSGTEKANARLIASAPELLKALQECKRVLAGYKSEEAINAWYKAQEVTNEALNTND